MPLIRERGAIGRSLLSAWRDRRRTDPQPPTPLERRAARAEREAVDAGWHWPSPDAYRAPVSAFERLCNVQAAARRDGLV